MLPQQRPRYTALTRLRRGRSAQRTRTAKSERARRSTHSPEKNQQAPAPRFENRRRCIARAGEGYRAPRLRRGRTLPRPERVRSVEGATGTQGTILRYRTMPSRGNDSPADRGGSGHNLWPRCPDKMTSPIVSTKPGRTERNRRSTHSRQAARGEAGRPRSAGERVSRDTLKNGRCPFRTSMPRTISAAQPATTHKNFRPRANGGTAQIRGTLAAWYRIIASPAPQLSALYRLTRFPPGSRWSASERPPSEVAYTRTRRSRCTRRGAPTSLRARYAC